MSTLGLLVTAALFGQAYRPVGIVSTVPEKGGFLIVKSVLKTTSDPGVLDGYAVNYHRVKLGDYQLEERYLRSELSPDNRFLAVGYQSKGWGFVVVYDLDRKVVIHKLVISRVSKLRWSSEPPYVLAALVDDRKAGQVRLFPADASPSKTIADGSTAFQWAGKDLILVRWMARGKVVSFKDAWDNGGQDDEYPAFERFSWNKDKPAPINEPDAWRMLAGSPHIKDVKKLRYQWSPGSDDIQRAPSGDAILWMGYTQRRQKKWSDAVIRKNSIRMIDRNGMYEEGYPLKAKILDPQTVVYWSPMAIFGDEPKAHLQSSCLTIARVDTSSNRKEWWRIKGALATFLPIGEVIWARTSDSRGIQAIAATELR